jgi:hypothetical protein
VAYNIINAADSLLLLLLLLKGFRGPDFLEEHGTCEEIAARTVEIKALVSSWRKWRNDVRNEAVFGTTELSDDDSGDDSEDDSVSVQVSYPSSRSIFNDNYSTTAYTTVCQ